MFNRPSFGEQKIQKSPEQKVTEPTITPVKAKAIKRLMIAGAISLTLAACNTIEQLSNKPQVNANTPISPAMQVSPTPFQPVEYTPTTIFLPTQEVPLQPTIIVEASVSPIPEIVEQDPLFLDKNSYILRNPTEIIYTPEQAEIIANGVLQRLRELGITSDNGAPITARFREPEPGIICEADSIKRRISCFPSGPLYLMPDSSLISHELTHVTENDSPTRNIGELRATVAAYILSGRNPNINDRYLFETKYDINGKPLIFSASDFVRAMEAQGVTEIDLLRFNYNYEPYRPMITQAAIRWLSSLADLSKNSAFLIDSTYQEGAAFLDAVAFHRYGINPYNNLLTPETTMDVCRANSMPTNDLLQLVGPQCVLLK